MNIGSWLNLTTVQVGRVTETADGMGAMTATTVLTTLSRAAIWMAGSGDRTLSDKVAQGSTHILAHKTSEYTWAANDAIVVYGSNTYSVVGRADDVSNISQLTIVGLDRVS